MSVRTLADLVQRLHEVDLVVEGIGDLTLPIDDAHHDSRAVSPGSIFCCVRGARSDGHDHASAAIRAGAVALVTERPLDLGVPELRVDDVRMAMGPLAAVVHADPARAMTCVGVTGTNGKTTTVELLAAIGRAAGHVVGEIGTLTGARTTPESTDLQRELARFRSQGCTMVVMEVSSHGLVQHRVDGMLFAASAFTNLSPDHLDFHGSLEEYFRAKARLFEPEHSTRAVVNTDDPHGRLLLDAAVIPTVGFCLADAEPIESINPLRFHFHGQPVESPLVGRFNLSNALGAATLAAQLGIDDDAIRAGLEAAPRIPGRFEVIPTEQPFRVVVDFAHTPDGLDNVLATAREIAGSARVLVVVGAGGDRDPSKRPAMGAAAERHADVVVLTSDNPRSESADQIVREIQSGMHDRVPVLVELDRRRAIAVAFDQATSGDVVVIAGKGHETTQIVGSTVTEFDDRRVARELLDGLAGRK